MYEFNRLLQCELQREVFHACTHAKMHGGILTPYLWSGINVSITWVGGFFLKGGGGGGGVGILYLVSNSGEIRGRKNKQPQSFILSTQEKKSLTTG